MSCNTVCLKTIKTQIRENSKIFITLAGATILCVVSSIFLHLSLHQLMPDSNLIGLCAMFTAISGSIILGILLSFLIAFQMKKISSTKTQHAKLQNSRVFKETGREEHNGAQNTFPPQRLNFQTLPPTTTFPPQRLNSQTLPPTTTPPVQMVFQRQTHHSRARRV